MVLPGTLTAAIPGLHGTVSSQENQREWRNITEKKFLVSSKKYQKQAAHTLDYFIN